jgi:hypothetical protein
VNVFFFISGPPFIQFIEKSHFHGGSDCSGTVNYTNCNDGNHDEQKPEIADDTGDEKGDNVKNADKYCTQHHFPCCLLPDAECNHRQAQQKHTRESHERTLIHHGRIKSHQRNDRLWKQQ